MRSRSLNPAEQLGLVIISPLLMLFYPVYLVGVFFWLLAICVAWLASAAWELGGLLWWAVQEAGRIIDRHPCAPQRPALRPDRWTQPQDLLAHHFPAAGRWQPPQ